MKIGVLFTMLGIGGLLISGCAPAGRGAGGAPSAAVASMATIRSQSNLQRYLAATASSGSPLSALSSGARTRFLASVTFNGKGITGFHYGDLQSELTASQILGVLHLFGADKDVALIPNVRVESAADRRAISSLVDPNEPVGDGTDYKGYYCASRATCGPSRDSICTSNC